MPVTTDPESSARISIGSRRSTSTSPSGPAVEPLPHASIVDSATAKTDGRFARSTLRMSSSSLLVCNEGYQGARLDYHPFPP